MCPQARWIIFSLWIRLPWLTRTPLGVDVEPDVYCRNAIVSGLTRGSCQACASPSRCAGSSRNSVAIQCSAESCGIRASACAWERISAVVRIAVGRASFKIESSRGNVRCDVGG